MTSRRSTRMPSCRTLVLAALLASLACPAPVMAQADFVLQTREQRPWALPANLERVAIADPSVADVVMLRGNKQALLVGKAPGTTTLLLWQRGQTDPQRMQIDVRSAVQGALSSEGSGTQLTVQDGTALLQGSAPTLLEHERAYKAAGAAVGKDGNVTDTSTVGLNNVVQVEVKVVEFNRSTLRQIGVNFQKQNGGFSWGVARPGGGGGGSDGDDGSNPLSSAFRIALGSSTDRWTGDIDLLASNGLARVLAEPTLVALSGQSASFLAGGELPILEPQGLGTTTITFKPFGIGLTVSPTVLSPDRIALKVAPEASDLDYSNALTLNGVQVPSITTRRADTTVELGDGESFVIGGLVSSTTASTVNKVPLLGDIPIIGSFFRNLDYKRQDKELVIIVTPRLVRPLARNTELTLPGEREAASRAPVWGSWLLHPAGPDSVPGFSR